LKDKKMNYLTNYYKNLCEQLQEQVNNLEKLLEYRKSKIAHIDVHDVDPYTGESAPAILGYEVTKKGNPMGKGARKNKVVRFYPDYEDEAEAWESVSDTGRPTVQDNRFYASMRGQGSPMEVNRNELFQQRHDRPHKGGHEAGMGKKFKKKNLAIARAKDMNPNVHDGPDADNIASSAEVAASQINKQMGSTPEYSDYWFRNTMHRRDN